MCQRAKMFLSLLRDRQAAKYWHAEVVRLFHNWLASAGSLVDHGRNVTRPGGVFTEGTRETYVSRIKREFDNDRFHRFIQKLRNYTLHCDLPLTGLTMGGSLRNGVTQADWRQGVFLDLDGLREWSGWTGLAGEYLDGCETNPFLLDLVVAYSEKVRTLWEPILAEDQRERMQSLGCFAESPRFRVVGRRRSRP